MESLSRLMRRWERESVDPVAPPVEEDVRRVFAELGSVATPDVLAMYRITGGMGSMDDEMFRLWPLSDVLCEEEQDSGAGLKFADYSICSWTYRVRPVSPTRSAVYVDYIDDHGPLLIAESLEAFFDAYLADPDSALFAHLALRAR